MHLWITTASSSTYGLPEHCRPSSTLLEQLSQLLGTCIPTPLALVSSTLGILSIASWLFSQLPQIFRNYSLGSASGLSIYFLLEWCLGDSTNFLGALFTRQAAWQIVIAGYYVTADIVLVGQYAWYSHLKPRRTRSKTRGRDEIEHDNRGGGDDDENSPEPYIGTVIESILPGRAMIQTPNSSPDQGRDQDRENKDGTAKPIQILLEPTSPSSCSCICKEELDYESNRRSGGLATRPIAAPPRSVSPLISSRSLMYLSLLCAIATAYPSPVSTPGLLKLDATSSDRIELAGRILSWASTALYLGSRFPQLYKNYARRSTCGLSAKLFIAAFFGNLFYSTSLLTNPCAWSSFPAYGGGGWVGPEGSVRLEWIGRAIPFWLGAAGVLVLDGAVGIQFLMYQEEIEKEIVQDERGRWRRVTGWTRGWVPIPRSFSPTRVNASESEPLNDGDRIRVSYGSL